MSQDPFEQFERSRGGMLIPVVVFAIGAVLTLVAIDLLHGVRVREEAELRELQQAIEVEPILDPKQSQVAEPEEALKSTEALEATDESDDQAMATEEAASS